MFAPLELDPYLPNSDSFGAITPFPNFVSGTDAKLWPSAASPSAAGGPSSPHVNPAGVTLTPQSPQASTRSRKNSAESQVSTASTASRGKATPNGSPLPRRRKSSSFRGVSYNFKSNKWKAVITVKKKQTFLGYFKSEEAAARAYDEASKRIHGPQARLNFGFGGNAAGTAPTSDTTGPAPGDSLPPPPSAVGPSSTTAPSSAPVPAPFTKSKSRPRLELDISEEDLTFEVGSQDGSPRKRLRSVEEESKADSPTNVATSHWAKTSRYRGVSFNRKTNKFKAVITTKGKQTFLGYFESEVDAAKAYDAACIECRGASALLNFPRDSGQAAPTKPTIDTAGARALERKEGAGSPGPSPASSPLSAGGIKPQFHGVSWCKNQNKWKAVILSEHGTEQVLGYFDSQDAAAERFDDELKRRHGPSGPDNVAKNFGGPQMAHVKRERPMLSAIDTSVGSPFSPSSMLCLTPTTADLVERSSRLRLNSSDMLPTTEQSP